MKSKTMRLFFEGLVLLFFFSSVSQADPVLSVGSYVATLGETVEINIDVTDPSEVGAAVFSVKYGANCLALNPAPGDAGSLFFNAIANHDDKAGTIMFCGGRPVPSGSYNPVTIITFNFTVLPTAAGDCPITLEPTILDFSAAGYTGNPVPALTSAASYAALPTNLGAAVGLLSIDRDDDGLTDTEETVYGTDPNIPQTVAGIPDFLLHQYFSDFEAFDMFGDEDNDGCSNIRELLLGQIPGVTTTPIDGACESSVLLTTSDADNDVDGRDLYLLATEMGKDCLADPPCLCDYNNDNRVDEIDLGLFVEEFGSHE